MPPTRTGNGGFLLSRVFIVKKASTISFQVEIQKMLRLDNYHVSVSTTSPRQHRRSVRPSSPPLSWRLIRANGRPADVVAFEESVVTFFLEASEILGVPKSLAVIYGVCFASPTPLSFSEVQERLEISAGSISQGLRILRDVNALKVVATRMTKRELFEPDLELRKLISHYLEQRVEKQLDSGRGRLQAIGDAIPRGSPDSGKVLRTRLKSLQGWHDKTRRMLPVIKTLLKLTA